MSDINANTEIATNDPKITEEIKGESISGYIKADILQQLIDMGFSKNSSEKALFLNKSNLEQSIQWISDHQNDADFEEELRIVGTTVEEYLSV